MKKLFAEKQQFEKLKDFIKMTDHNFYIKRRINHFNTENDYQLFNAYSKVLLYNNKDGYYTLELLRKKMNEISNTERKKVVYYIDTLFREINRFYKLKTQGNPKINVSNYIINREKEFNHRFKYLFILDLQTRNLLEELTNSIFYVLKTINKRLKN